MKKTAIRALAFGLILAAACGKKAEEASKTPLVTDEELFAQPYVEKGTLPEGIDWKTNDADPIFADPAAKRGGTFYEYMLSFPLTLRTVGPDSNDAFRSHLLDNQVDLIHSHPETGKLIPGLATHWAASADHQTLYVKLNPKAVWSDGVPVTAMDFAFALHFMRSPHIVAPWYNTYYTEKFQKVVVYDDRTFAIVANEKKSLEDMAYYFAFEPRPRHFHKLDEKWVQEYNWKIEPNTGPYILTKVEKGKYVEFTRKKDWWGDELKYFKHRYNPDKVRSTVIRDHNIAWEHFKKGQLDGFTMVQPDFWYEKATGEIFDKGYVHKRWFYHERPQPIYGIYFNQALDLFKDRDVRIGFSHAFNVEKVIQTVLRGDYVRQESETMGHGIYDNDKIRARRFDLQKADEHLSKAGWKERGPDGIRVKDGKRLSVRVTYGYPHHQDRLVVLKEEAKKAGIELNLQLLDSAAAFKSMLEKQHEVAYTGWGAQDRPQYWGQWHCENANKPQTNNFANVCDKELDPLIMAYRKEFDVKKKAELARRIQQRIHDQAYMVTLYAAPYVRFGHWRWVGLPARLPKRTKEPFAYLFDGDWGGLYWIDAEKKAETEKAQKEGKAFEPSLVIDTRYKG